MKDTIRIAMIQPKPYPSFDDPRNIGHALTLLEKCRGETLDVVCLPEYFPYQGEKGTGDCRPPAQGLPCGRSGGIRRRPPLQYRYAL